MTPDRIFSDEQAEALISGRGPAGDGLAVFLRSTKASAQVAPDEATQARHLAAIAQAASQVVPAGTAPRTRSRDMVARIFRPRWAKIATGAVAVVFATGGLAAADVLPDPAQDAVASVAESVGLDLPDSHEADGDKVKDGMDHDGDGVADDNGKHRGQNKTGMDHDGDGDADDNGKHRGHTKSDTDDDATETDTDDTDDTDDGESDETKKPKDGMDHDGDGVADDNGEHRGQNKTGMDHDGDGDADDNGKRGGDDKPDKPGKPEKEREGDDDDD